MKSCISTLGELYRFRVHANDLALLHTDNRDADWNLMV